jgi:hypothetical protein
VVGVVEKLDGLGVGREALLLIDADGQSGQAAHPAEEMLGPLVGVGPALAALVDQREGGFDLVLAQAV